MPIAYDPAKNARNLVERGLAFADAEFFEWSTALIEEDTRKAYGERRFAAQGMMGDRLHVLVFTPREGNVHVISLRKANAREVKRYEKATQSRTS